MAASGPGHLGGLKRERLNQMATQSGGYLRTAGTKIVDSAGNPVRLAGVNWYGFDCDSMIPGGLGRTTIEETCGQIQSLGFNCIRLPYCVQAVVENAPRTQYLDANPDLVGKTR